MRRAGSQSLCRRGRGSALWRSAEVCWPSKAIIDTRVGERSVSRREGFLDDIRKVDTACGLEITHYAVLFLIVATLIEVFKTIVGIIRDLEKDNEILLAGALVAAFVPSGAVLFWGCKAFAVYLDLPIKRVRRYFRNHRKIYPLRHPIAVDLFDRQEPGVAFADLPAGRASRALEASPASSPDRAANVAREPPRSAQRGHHVGRRSGAGLWMCAAFCSALTLVIIVLAAIGTGEKGTGIALHLTGRLSLLFFWPAYAGAAMAALFGPSFAVLAR